MAIDLKQMQALIDYLKTLSAAPGKAYDQSETAYIAPDLIVKNINGTLQAESTTLVKPRIIFRKSYYESLVGELDQSVSDYLKEKKQYQTLVAELAQRQSTIERVGAEILARQPEFLRPQIIH